MEASKLLCDSYLCRLCAEENKNSANLFSIEENQQDLSQLVNKYLPLKVERDGKYPIVICPGCNIQLEATKQFLDLIIEGQNKLRDLFRLQQDTLRRQEKQRQQLESALKTVNPSTSVETYTIESDETGEKFVIQIFSEGPLFPPEHELSLKAEGLEKPRRRRGRPPKLPPSTQEEVVIAQETETLKSKHDADIVDDDEIDSEGRKKRKIKVPSRFQEAVQGKELDRIFKEEGVFDEDSCSEEDRQTQTNLTSLKDGNDEVIGHLQSKEGEDLGELVVINKSTNKIRIKTKQDVPNGKRKKYECEICSREFLHYGRYEVHKTCHKNIILECSDCRFQAELQSSIEAHHKETGHKGLTYCENLDDYGQVQLRQVSTKICRTKEISNLEIETMLEHEQLDMEQAKVAKLTDPENKFSCEICSKVFSCKQNYEVHCKAVHENQRPYQCDKCEKSFPYVNSLKCHMLQHSDKNEKLYACEVCEKIFNHPSSLVYHREAEHNNGRRFVCNKCNKSFKHKQLLQRHQLVHSDERPHSCKMCDASFKTRANLLNHMPIHTGEKKYYCTQCGQSFAHKTSLTLHTRWHSGQKPYECDVCMKTFSQKGNLAEHKRIHTGEKPYCCDHCGRKFTTSSQFKLHVKRHTGERPWQCEYCFKTFLHKDTWKCHTRRHRNERPYQCQQCFRGFTEQWALKKHERLHTGEKPYVCDICHKGFADCSNLTKHKKIHSTLKMKSVTKPRNIKVISTAGEGAGQVLYITYQDSNSNDNQLQTLVHIVDPTDSVANENESSTIEEDAFLTQSSLSEPLNEFQQVVNGGDDSGSVFNLTATNSPHIKVVEEEEEDQQDVQGLISNTTLVPINLAIQDKTVEGAKLNEDTNDYGQKLNGSVRQLFESDAHFLSEGQKLDNSVRFLTEDGQNVCFVTTYNIEDNINPQYLAMA